MKRRGSIAALAGSGTVALAADCGGPAPATLALRLAADLSVNPDRRDAPKPMRVLQLAGAPRVSQVDSFALDPARALGPGFLAAEDVVLDPGQTLAPTPDAKPGIRTLGVAGACFAIERDRWPAWPPVGAGASNAYTARFDASGATLMGPRA